MELLKGFIVEEGKEYIYLVMVEYKDKTLLKIGYTKTIEGRMDTYELHNPDIQLLKIREGTRNLENYMHRKFEKYAYPKREEWFYYNEEIINGFNVLEEKNFLNINQLKNRIYNFLKPKSIDSLKEMYYEKYHEEIENERIDEEDLNTLITNTFYFINEKIKNFILSFDYSGIPLELDLSTHYQIIIPNPISSVDISMDLEQILGRQRLKENPWKNYARMFVKITKDSHKTTKEEFDKRLEEKKQNSINLLSSYEKSNYNEQQTLVTTYRDMAKTFHYKNNYVAVNEHAGNTLVPVFNNLMMVSEMRAFEVQQVDYADRFSVFNAVNKRLIESASENAMALVRNFNGLSNSVEKLRYLVKLSEENISEKDMMDFLSIIPARFRDYYIEMGPDRIKANGCRETRLKEEWNKQKRGEAGISEDLANVIFGYFKLGHRYSKSGIKETLKEMYQKYGYQKTAKASDLQEYFWTKDVKFLENGKWVNGFEIQGKR